ncbi:MAG: sensor histidine kinase [Desulfosudaceae bacterium]
MTLHAHSKMQQSSPSDKFHLNPVTLKFSGPLKNLEEDFLNDFAWKSLTRVRACIVLGLILFVGFGPLDPYLVPEAARQIFIVRYAVMTPFLLLMLPLSYRPWIHKHLQPIISAVIVLCGLAIISLALLINNYFYMQAYALSLTFILLILFAILPARFVWATASSLILMAAFNLAMFFFSEMNGRDLFILDCFFAGLILAGMFACYSREHKIRKDFFLSFLLQKERERIYEINCQLEASQKKIMEINNNLENLVEERTAELVRKNEELKREIEERERLQKKMLRAERMEALGVLAGGIAHDLHNVLSGLTGLPELLMVDLPPDDPMREPLAMIQQSGSRASRIVQDLLSLARREVITTEAVQLNDVIDHYLSSPEHKNLLKSYPGIEIRVQPDPDLPPLRGAESRLLNVVMNLVFNAVEAMGERGGLISIKTEKLHVGRDIPSDQDLQEGDHVVLTISDTGPGIPDEEVKKIFDPFFTTKKTNGSGSGLGLSVVWAAVSDHGGHVKVQSRVGQGTSFILYFPVWRQTDQDV